MWFVHALTFGREQGPLHITASHYRWLHYCEILYFKSIRLVEYISHTLSFRWSHRKKDLLPLDLMSEEVTLCFCSKKSVTVETMRLCCTWRYFIKQLRRYKWLLKQTMFDVDLIPVKTAGQQAMQRYFYSDPLLVAYKLTGLLGLLISQQRIFFSWDY